MVADNRFGSHEVKCGFACRIAALQTQAKVRHGPLGTAVMLRLLRLPGASDLLWAHTRHLIILVGHPPAMSQILFPVPDA